MGGDNRFRRGQNRRNNKRGGGGHFHHKSDRSNHQSHPDNREKFNRYESSKNVTLREDQIGITEYVRPGPGFTGIIKHRISDFQVSEIDLDGNVAKLTDIKAPVPPKDEAELADKDTLLTLITAKKYEEILELSSEASDVAVLIDVTLTDKPQRTLIHNAIKSTFSGVTSSTIDVDGVKYIKCAKQSGKDDRRTKWPWPHEYTYFLLHKDNIDTMQAVATLAPLLSGARTSALTYAGTKDKRGRTTQWACIRHRDPAAIVRAAARLPNIHVGNFAFKSQPLKLGQLEGNRFRIALRQVSAEDQVIEDALQNFKQSGFINYYGLQRFGNHSSVPTHRIGLALLKGQYKEACELILQPRESDIPFMAQIRECWWKTRDAKQALGMFRNKGSGRGVEQSLLQGLVKNGPNDFVNALEMIPRNVRLMYIHAYQSLVWNEVASRRIKVSQLKLREGDLIFANTAQTTQEIIDDDQVAEEANETVPECEEAKADDSENPSRFKTMVRPLTAADIDSGNFSIFDVVLPLPGHDITYPGNECSQWYEERLAQDDLSSEKLKQKHKSYSLTGAYRKLLVKPGNLSWTIVRYHNDTDALIRSDIEELRGEPAPVNADDGQLKGLILDFALPSSTYATMALREVLKADTSAANQCQLQRSEVAKRALEASDDTATDGVEAKKGKIDADAQPAEEQAVA